MSLQVYMYECSTSWLEGHTISFHARPAPDYLRTSLHAAASER